MRYSQLSKQILIYLPLMLMSVTSFGQFTMQLPRDGRLKGRVDSVVSINYNILKKDTVERRAVNDKYTYFYNTKGLLLKEHLSDGEGKDSELYQTSYTYHDNGYLKQVLEYDAKGNLRDEENYTFDPSKRLVVVKEAGSVTSEMLLDDTGNIIKTIIYNDYPSPFSTLRFKYDSKGLCIESIQCWSKSADIQKIVYDYDADQHLVKETVHNNAKLLSAYTYTYSKYDQSQNWLVQHTYRNGKLSGISERSITYQRL